MSTQRATGPLLAGLRVIDLSVWQPGHVATQLLADLGADVIKAEPPGGDRMRPQNDRFLNWNSHKRSMIVDLKRTEDRDRLLALVAEADVVVEGFRPGVAERLGVGFEPLRAIKPSIVLCSITGFGQEGPLANVAGHDFSYQAYAGAFTFPEGQPPAHAGMLAGDMGSGLAAAFAILAAVLCARSTGEGEHIDVSIADLLASWVLPTGPVDDAARPEDGSVRAQADRLPGMGCFRTRDDRWVELAIYSEDNLWDLLCTTLGLAHHAGLSMTERAESADLLRADVARVIGARDRDGLMALVLPVGLPVSPVLTRDEMLAHPHYWHRGVVQRDAEGRRRAGHPIRYLVHPTRPPGEAPGLDADRGASFG